MTFTDRETTIQQMSEEFNLAPDEYRKQKVLTAWRAKLGKEPNSLPSFRIDSIVREVRKRRIVISA